MLNSRQRAQLRAMANDMETIFQVGKSGITENTIKQVVDALEARELIKARVLENSGYTAKDASAEIINAAAAQLKEVESAMKAIQATVNQADITYTAELRKCDANNIAYTIPADLEIKEEPETPAVSEEEEETTEVEEEEENIKNIEEVEEYNYTKYTDDTGSIVAVTYGGKNGNDNEAYKTFILNYNSFSVEVVFEGTTYTIPAFGLVVIYR